MGSSATLCSTFTTCACGSRLATYGSAIFAHVAHAFTGKLNPPSPSPSVFASAEEDEIKDLSVQARIRQLHWVTPEHLEANIKLDVPEVASAIESAQEELITMDAKRAPQDKLACVVACSKSIFDILSKSAGEGVSVTFACPIGHLERGLTSCARTNTQSALFLRHTECDGCKRRRLSPRSHLRPYQGKPAHAAFKHGGEQQKHMSLPTPPRLLQPSHRLSPSLHRQFINRFCNPDRLMAGEAGYYYTNLMGAASFVENLNAEQVCAKSATRM
jgi:hypothetical protein